MPGRTRFWSLDQLAAAVGCEISLAGVLRRLGLRAAGGNYVHVSRTISDHGLSTAHRMRQGHLRGRRIPHAPKIPLHEILVDGSTFNSHKLRRRLIAEGFLAVRCASCANVEWLGRPIPLELDHVDGNRRNNQLYNLRLLCPNCHALTPTYRGKNIALRRQSKR